jgi:hypothetical protein
LEKSYTSDIMDLADGMTLFRISACDRLRTAFDVPGIHFIPGVELRSVFGKTVGGGNAHFAVAQIESKILYLFA